MKHEEIYTFTRDEVIKAVMKYYNLSTNVKEELDLNLFAEGLIISKKIHNLQVKR